MRLGRRIVQLIFGAEVDSALRPVLAVQLVGSMAGSTLWSFMAIWAVEELDGKSLLPFSFAVGAVLAGVSGFVGGSLSDRVGRRSVILFGNGVMVGYPLVLLAIGDRTVAGIVALSLAGVFGALGGSVGQAMVADLVPRHRHAEAYASVRVASNFGVVMGPPLGGVLLIAGSWTALFIGVCALSALSWLFAFRFLPQRGRYAPDEPPAKGSNRIILRDTPFLLFLGSAIFAWLVYVAYEIVLPVSLVDGFGYEPAAWGFLVWINPLLVTLFQMRLTRATADVGAPKPSWWRSSSWVSPSRYSSGVTRCWSSSS